MRAVSPGDVVFHLTDNLGFTGISNVESKVDDTFTGISGTAWGGQPGYRVGLKDYRQLSPPLLRETFFGDEEFRRGLLATLQDKEHGPLFYNKALELNQGAYLTEAPLELVQLLNRAYEKSAGKPLPILLPKLKQVEAMASYTVEDALEELFIDIGEVESSQYGKQRKI